MSDFSKEANKRSPKEKLLVSCTISAPQSSICTDKTSRIGISSQRICSTRKLRFYYSKEILNLWIGYFRREFISAKFIISETRTKTRPSSWPTLASRRRRMNLILMASPLPASLPIIVLPRFLERRNTTSRVTCGALASLCTFCKSS